MISKYTYKKLTWIDVESPTKDELALLAEEYNIPSLIQEELSIPMYRSKVDKHEKMIYMVLHFPTSNQHHNKKHFEQEIDFVIGKDFVITVHYEPVDTLYEFSKLFEINSTLERGLDASHAGYLFFLIMSALYKHVITELEGTNAILRDIEHKVFDGEERHMVQVISNTNHMLVDFKQSVRFHAETLNSFEKATVDFFGQDFSYYTAAIIGEYKKVQKMLDDHKEVLSDLRETNDSLLTSKTNDIITKLTIMNFVMLPLGLITWIFAMDSEVTFIKTKTDFLLILLGMVLLALVMIIYFKKKKWL